MFAYPELVPDSRIITLYSFVTLFDIKMILLAVHVSTFILLKCTTKAGNNVIVEFYHYCTLLVLLGTIHVGVDFIVRCYELALCWYNVL